MNEGKLTYRGGPIFDGTNVREDCAAVFQDGVFVKLQPISELAPNDTTVDLNGDILSPGYVDLQVNGGGGVMFNDDPTPEILTRIAMAHRQLGTLWFLPTLITDTYAKTRAAIKASETAIAEGIPGVAGLHLEGPHISVARKGAHDPTLIRPMGDDDLAFLLNAAQKLPALMLTVAPESVSLAQVSELSAAGAVVSLGHTDADFDTCIAYTNAGARCVTHLFNAMSQLGSRDPGLVGAALDCDRLSAGLIVDGIHVHPATMRAAWRAKTSPGKLFLVTDAMAAAGTNMEEFFLGSRLVRRRDGQLKLEDGTLAGADLDLTRAMKTLHETTDLRLAELLAAVTSGPANLIGSPNGRLAPGISSELGLVRIRPDFSSVEPLVPG